MTFIQMLDFQDSERLQKSFQEFTKQPENAGLVELAQKEEMQAALDAQEADMLRNVWVKVNACDQETRRVLTPFLEYRPLCRIVATLFNDPATDVSAWASNPVVLQMLRRARRMLRDGTLREGELQEALLAFLKSPTNPHKAEFEQHASLGGLAATPDQLAAAMNEQLEERQLGNRAYRSGDPRAALHHYTRGLNVLRLLRPENPNDQQVVREAETALLLNSAAAHLSAGAPGACVEACSAVLRADPANFTAYLRRARAHMLRREYEAAEADLAAAEALSDGCRGQQQQQQQQVDCLRAELRALRQRDRRADKDVYGRMFKT